MRLIDFHNHYAGPEWPALAPPGRPPELAHAWAEIAQRIADLDDVLASLEQAQIDTRVLGAPPALLTPPERPLPTDTIHRINEHLAEQVADHPDRLIGLATIDAFQGESAAEQAQLASELGLAGLIVDCQRDELLLDAPQACPTLELACSLRLPVFVHPISPPAASRQLARLGRLGVSLVRGTAAAASLLALISSGTLDELQGLRVVIPMLGAATLLHAVLGDQAWRLRHEAPDQERWHVYVDTMGFDAAAIRFVVDVVGADHVLLGSDWPIWSPSATRARVTTVLTAAGLDQAAQELVAGENALALLARTAVA
jgi:predicted TIM-barrel fold metal-dependent hydrolase